MRVDRAIVADAAGSGTGTRTPLLDAGPMFPKVPFQPLALSHVDGLVLVGGRFHAESSHPSEYAPEVLREFLQEGIKAQLLGGYVLCVPEVAGGCIFQLQRVFTQSPVAIQVFLYVLPDFRASAAGRSLLTLAMHDAFDAGATAFFGGFGSAITAAEPTLRNLYRRLGFAEAGATFVKEP